ncbi:MAG: TonB-dependent receptor, partial [Qipengyuania sp.]
MKTRFASLSVLAMLGAGAALAPQSALAQDAVETQDADDNDLLDNADVDQGAPVIVVTAQGRRQTLSDVPLSVNAVSAETLQNSGTNDIRELTQVA